MWRGRSGRSHIGQYTVRSWRSRQGRPGLTRPKPGNMPQYKRYLDECRAFRFKLWTIYTSKMSRKERLGYPTQKPLRSWSASSPHPQTLATWCSTLSAVAAQLSTRPRSWGRRWIGIDVTHLAISLVERRCGKLSPASHTSPRHPEGPRGRPRPRRPRQPSIPDVDRGSNRGAALTRAARRVWTVASTATCTSATPRKKRGRGNLAASRRLPSSWVKGGGIKSGDIRDLKGTMERVKAPLGLFLKRRTPQRARWRRKLHRLAYTKRVKMKFPTSSNPHRRADP